MIIKNKHKGTNIYIDVNPKTFKEGNPYKVYLTFSYKTISKDSEIKLNKGWKFDEFMNLLIKNIDEYKGKLELITAYIEEYETATN